MIRIGFTPIAGDILNLCRNLRLPDNAKTSRALMTAFIDEFFFCNDRF